MSKIKYFLYSLIPLILLLLLSESFVRVFDPKISKIDYANLWLDSSFEKEEFIKEKNINGNDYFFSDQYPVVYYYNDFNDKRLSGKYVLKEKNKKSFRFFSFGGSSTAGSPFGHWASFSRFLDDQLKIIASKDINVESINFGTSGGTVRRAEFIFDKVKHLKPDVIFIYAGHNEICDQGAESIAVRENKKLDIANELASSISKYSKLYTLMSNLYSKYKIFSNPPAPPIKNLRFNNHQCVRPKMAYDLDKMKNDYEFFLRKLIIQAKEVDVKVVLVSQIANMLILPSNLITTETDSGIKPVKSINDELNGERDILLKTSNEELQNLLSLNKLDELRKYIDKLLEQDNKDPVAYYYLGLSYLAEENNKLARKNFLLAQEYDRMPFRFRPSYIGVLSRLAKNHENTYFVNLDENIEYLIPDGIADGRIVMDTMHPTIELNKFIANEIVEKFFIKNLIRDDLFDYKMFSSKSLYGPFSDANKYGLICKRFYQLENWEECIKLARSEYEASSGLGNLANRRRQSRLWESIYYNGVSNKIDKRQESRKIAPMPSNEI